MNVELAGQTPPYPVPFTQTQNLLVKFHSFLQACYHLFWEIPRVLVPCSAGVLSLRMVDIAEVVQCPAFSNLK